MDKNKLQHAILKEIDIGNIPLNAEIFGISDIEFVNNVNSLMAKKLIVNAKIDFTSSLYEAEITSDGENYLNENSTRGKIYRTAKEIRDWIK
ncbi:MULTISPECIES: YjcQ family protein [Bacillus subtilis group]|uniref:YjcQ family protein n=1 Tax=Bacillus halotolerans TaxID=260554 RepID=A0ABY7I5F1_9BACI|nr:MULTISPECIES: YjcQ family protein [Bacillus subtilis group]MCY8281218.1 YjcQ family protein [Bacillus inaquosorum]MDG0765399.1 YjcQ family protein [Bacillus halotolerans]WAT23155.1 YjcQ family protein [Bacillus halotolerans]